MNKSPWLTFFVLIFIFGTLSVFLLGSTTISLFGDSPVRISPKNSILHLELQGVILDGKRFLKPLQKYRKDPYIKAVVIEVNSPGGVVGPSQELYYEIKRTREEFKIPVVVVSTSLIASGAFYAAMGADYVIAAPGTLVGSIGVIMEFTNLEKLYAWAKISRYSINTGKYKDSGAEYRGMRDDERKLFQDLMDNVLGQFKQAVADGRKLKLDQVTPYADGRIFTGEQAKKIGFIDEVGSVQSAFDKAAEMAHLGKNYEIYEPPKKRPGIMELISGNDEDDYTTEKDLVQQLLKISKVQLVGKPLFLMPGSY